MIHYIDVDSDAINDGLYITNSGCQKTTEWHVQSTKGKTIQLRPNLYPVKLLFQNEVEIHFFKNELAADLY